MRPRQYAKLAGSNLVKNARFYIPYILAGGGLEACFYIVFTLALDNRMREVRGGSYIPGFMMFGSFITIILSFILILYANGFLMKQRKKEFGLLNVLGLEKKHVGRILLMETLISSVIAMAGGLVAGVLFYKLCTLAIAMFLRVDAVKSFYYIKAVTILPTLGLFALLYLLTYIINRVSIARMKPVELLKSDHTGEKEPKIKWIFLVLGFVTLAAGYYLAITTVSPLAAINRFFIAVILVIIATYCLFITGSIAVLKFLKRKKSFYYQKNHMVAISGLMYRMKSNSVGLSSITILSCAVLVMLSTTVSLYAGIEDTLKQKFPYEFYIASSYEVEKDEALTMVDVPAEVLSDIIEKASEEFGLSIEESVYHTYLEVDYNLIGDTVSYDQDGINFEMVNLTDIIYMTNDDYAQATGIKLNLSGNDIALCSYNIGHPYKYDSLKVGGRELKIKDHLTEFPVNTDVDGVVVNVYGVVVADQSVLDDIDKEQKDHLRFASTYTKRLSVRYTDYKAVEAVGSELDARIHELLRDYVDVQEGSTGAMNIRGNNRWETAEFMYGMDGVLLFLGLILGVAFLFTTVLIIYYKQISEGYEDRERFQIMEKIGMSSDEVKKTIRLQILMVFFLPLVVSAIHVAVAFHIIELLLHILLMSDTALFLRCSIYAFLGFALVYTMIYMVTARTYYKIVHN